MIVLQDVEKTFSGRMKDTPALTKINLAVNDGEFVAIVGPSGCGKSTILNLVAGLTSPTAGTIGYKRLPVPRPNTDVGYMTQHDSLLPWRTARDNIALPLEIARRPKKERRIESERYLELVGLTGFGDHYPSELSGGMKQRVALARTLLYSPKTLLMDEPFGALDAQTRLVLQREFLAIWGQYRKTVLFVTHDLGEAIALADRVVVIGGRPGTIIADLEVPLARPRDVLEVQGTEAFVGLYRRVAELLGITWNRAKTDGASRVLNE